MDTRGSHTVAVIQHAPVWMDREATLQRAVALIDEAAANGARLVAFPEAFVPGFPTWTFCVKPSDYATTEALYALLLDQAVDLTGDDLRPLQEAARTRQVTVVCGVNERNRAYSRTTMYNTVVVIGPDGRLLNRHRKLVPTNAERIVWGMGDASGLRPVDTPVGRVGALICWENYMPLARFSLYAQGIELYIAPTWARTDRWIATMRHIAFEGRCWVLGSGSIFTVDDIPPGIPGRDQIVSSYGGTVINDGDSVIVNPEGEIVAGPLRAETGILYAECDPAAVARARLRLDVAGHYGRPDVFRLHVDRQVGNPVEFSSDDLFAGNAAVQATSGSQCGVGGLSVSEEKYVLP